MDFGLALLLFILLFISILCAGVFFLLKYAKTKDKKFLVIGLLLTFVVLGILIFIFIIVPSTMILYAPPEVMG